MEGRYEPADNLLPSIMALQPELIDFFFQQIELSVSNTLRGNVGQLFEHLALEVKDNPVFNTYQQQVSKWSDWLDKNEGGNVGIDWEMPHSFTDAKQLAYAMYKQVETSDEDWLFFVTGADNLDVAVVSFNRYFLPHFKQALRDISNANPESARSTLKKVGGKTVFIIHGHDQGLKTELQLLLKNAGVACIVLHQEADMGRTVIDKLTEESEQSNFAVAVLSPDDLLVTGQYRARQNVILEMGYFVGLLGKERVRLLVKGDIEIPSDLYGILYERYDEPGAWKARLLKELIAAGIFVDLAAVINSY